MSPLVRMNVSCSERGAAEVAYVSFDRGKSWWVLHPDGTTDVQYRTPPVPLVFRGCWCDEEG